MIEDHIPIESIYFLLKECIGGLKKRGLAKMIFFGMQSFDRYNIGSARMYYLFGDIS